MQSEKNSQQILVFCVRGAPWPTRCLLCAGFVGFLPESQVTAFFTNIRHWSLLRQMIQAHITHFNFFNNNFNSILGSISGTSTRSRSFVFSNHVLAFLFPLVRATWTAHLILVALIIVIIYKGQCKAWTSSKCSSSRVLPLFALRAQFFCILENRHTHTTA